MQKFNEVHVAFLKSTTSYIIFMIIFLYETGKTLPVVRDAVFEV